MIKIKWRKTGSDPNDIFAEYEGYTLRVERMSRWRWWWALYFNNDEIVMDDIGVTGNSLKEGKKLAEVAFWTHRRTFKNT